MTPLGVLIYVWVLIFITVGSYRPSCGIEVTLLNAYRASQQSRQFAAFMFAYIITVTSCILVLAQSSEPFADKPLYPIKPSRVFAYEFMPDNS